MFCVGSLVVKKGDADKGKIGIVLEITENSIGYKFIKVLSEDGKIKQWYADLVEVLNKNDRRTS